MRTFLPWTEPFLPSAADILVSRSQTASGIDLSNLILVVPGARAGRRLLEILASRAEASDQVLVPPRSPTLTPGTLAEHLYDPARLPHPPAPGATARQAWCRAIAETPEGILRSVFPDRAAFRGLTARNLLAHLLDSLNQTLGGCGRAFAQVAEECSKGFLFSDEERWVALSHIQERYWRILNAAGFLDREVARRLVLRDGLASAPGEIILMGVVEMPGILSRILETLGGRVHALVHAPEELDDHFDRLGLIRPEAWVHLEIPLEDEALILADRPGHQASAVLQGLTELVEPVTGEDITVGVPDETVVPFLEQRLGAYGIPFRYAGGVPLSRTSPFRFLSAVGAYLSDRTFRSLAELLRHPVFSGPRSRFPGARELDAYFTRHLPGRIDPAALPSEAAGGVVASGLRALHGPELLAPLAGKATLAEWMEPILALLARVFQEDDLSRETPRGRRITEGCLQIRHRAQALHELPGNLDETCDAGEAIQVLLAEMSGDAIPPEALEEAVELVGWLELHLDDAPILFLTGANEGTLPGSVEVDPFLPNNLRARLGLPDNEFRFGRDAYLLTAILHSRQVRVIAGRRNAGGEPLRPSRLLLTGRGPEMARRVLRFSRESSSVLSPPSLEPLALRPALRTGFRLPPEPALPLPELPRPIPVTAFRSILADPYLWVLEGLWKLEETSDDLQELDPMAFGQLAHRVLEAFGRSPESSSDDPETVASRLDRILEQASLDLFGETPLPSVPIQVAQLQARLRSFARWQASWVAEGWRIQTVEARTIPEGAPFMVDGEAVFLSGRIDRIDVHGETGEWVIFDYKTGDKTEDPNRTHRTRGGWKDLQLPLYRHLIRYLDGPPLPLPDASGEDPSYRLAYLPLSRSEEEVSPAFASWSLEELAEADETAREVIRSLRQAGAISFRPGATGSRARGSLAALLGRGVIQVEDPDQDGDGNGGEG